MKEQSELIQVLTIISPWVMAALGVLASIVALLMARHNRERIEKVEGALHESPLVNGDFADRRKGQKHVLNATEERRKNHQNSLQDRP